MIFTKKLINIASQIASITEKIVPTLPGVTTTILYSAIVHNIIGTEIFKTINIVIMNGLKDVISDLTHMGSNELNSAKFPVPKNPSKANVSYKKIKLI